MFRLSSPLPLAVCLLLWCAPALAANFGVRTCRNECALQIFADPTDGKTIEVEYNTNGPVQKRTLQFVDGRAQFFYTTDERAGAAAADRITSIKWKLGLPYDGCTVDTLSIHPQRSEERRCLDLKQTCGAGTRPCGGPRKCGRFSCGPRTCTIPGVESTALSVYTDVFCRCTTGPLDTEPVRMVSGIPGESAC